MPNAQCPTLSGRLATPDSNLGHCALGIGHCSGSGCRVQNVYFAAI
jgi:hypothetical protein